MFTFRLKNEEKEIDERRALCFLVSHSVLVSLSLFACHSLFCYYFILIFFFHLNSNERVLFEKDFQWETHVGNIPVEAILK